MQVRAGQRGNGRKTERSVFGPTRQPSLAGRTQESINLKHALAQESLCLKHGNPVLHLSQQRDGDRAAEMVARFLEENKVGTLNVAGSRLSKEPEVYEWTKRVLVQCVAFADTAEKD